MENLFLFAIGGTEAMLVFFAVLLLFGGKKIPELMRGIGKGIREFNVARSTIESELRDGMREAERQVQQPQQAGTPQQLDEKQ
jgi:sec-independent protein translocase protein TatA